VPAFASALEAAVSGPEDAGGWTIRVGDLRQLKGRGSLREYDTGRTHGWNMSKTKQGGMGLCDNAADQHAQF
jgi:hypothetical protein